MRCNSYIKLASHSLCSSPSRRKQAQSIQEGQRQRCLISLNSFLFSFNSIHQANIATDGIQISEIKIRHSLLPQDAVMQVRVARRSLSISLSSIFKIFLQILSVQLLGFCRLGDFIAFKCL